MACPMAGSGFLAIALLLSADNNGPSVRSKLYYNVIRPGCPTRSVILYHATCHCERCCYRADAPPPSMHNKPSPLVSSQRAPALDERLIRAARGSLFPVSQQSLSQRIASLVMCRGLASRCRGQTVPLKCPPRLVEVPELLGSPGRRSVDRRASAALRRGAACQGNKQAPTR